MRQWEHVGRASNYVLGNTTRRLPNACLSWQPGVLCRCEAFAAIARVGSAAGGRASPTDMVESSSIFHTNCGGQPTGYIWPITTHPSREIVEPIMLRNIFTQQRDNTVERSVSEGGRGHEPGTEQMRHRDSHAGTQTRIRMEKPAQTHIHELQHTQARHTQYVDRKAKQVLN